MLRACVATFVDCSLIPRSHESPTFPQRHRHYCYCLRSISGFRQEDKSISKFLLDVAPITVAQNSCYLFIHRVREKVIPKTMYDTCRNGKSERILTKLHSYVPEYIWERINKFRK